MLDFRVSSHAHFDEACRKFAATHNVKELANKAAIKPQSSRIRFTTNSTQNSRTS